MSNSIFINFPWSKNPSNENFVTEGQILQVYTIISNALMQKIRSETNWESLSNTYVGSLNDIKVYNAYINEINKKIFDEEARKYTIDCIKSIKDCNLHKKNVAKSVYTLYNTLWRNSLTKELFGVYLSSNKKKFVDFKELFDLAKTTLITDITPQIQEIRNDFKTYCDRVTGNIK